MFGYLGDCFALWNDWRKTRQSPVHQSNFIDDPNVRAKTSIVVNDNENLKAKYRLSDDDIINLAGGFPTNSFVEAEFSATSLPGYIIKTELNYDFGIDSNRKNLFGSIKRTIDLKERVIHNDLMFIQKQGTGLGTNAFINQIMTAIGSLIDSIEVVAAGPDTSPPPFYPFKWDGYKTWIKFGYLLAPDDDAKYKNWMLTTGLKEDTLNKLYFQEQNYHHWESDGFTWEGTIELKKSRINILLFKLYLLKKNINVSLSSIAPAEVLALLHHKISLCTKR